MSTQVQNGPETSSTEFTRFTSQELVDLIVKGRPGSQRSRYAILELVDRDETIRTELEHIWGIVPQELEQNKPVFSVEFRTPETTPIRKRSLALLFIASMIISSIIITITLLASGQIQSNIGILNIIAIVIMSFLGGIVFWAVGLASFLIVMGFILFIFAFLAPKKAPNKKNNK